MPKGVKIVLVITVILFAAAVVAMFVFNRQADRKTVEIVQNGEVIYTLDLASEKDRSFNIDSPDGGYNTVTISGGTICISDADCPDKTCIKTGTLRYESVPIVCLPHKLVIKLVDEPKDGG